MCHCASVMWISRNVFVFVVLYLVGIDTVVSITCKFEYFASLAYYATVSSFGGVDPLILNFIMETINRNMSFEPLSVNVPQSPKSLACSPTNKID